SHAHPITADPTGNAAMRGTPNNNGDLRHLDRASRQFVSAANVVLEWVAGTQATTWAGVLHANAQLMPGTIQAGLDVDDERAMPTAIAAVSKAVDVVEAIATLYLPREPTE